jgi:hypothetical protein
VATKRYLKFNLSLSDSLISLKVTFRASPKQHFAVTVKPRYFETASAKKFCSK